MIPPEIRYFEAESVPDAIRTLDTYEGGDPAVLAGGQGLVRKLKRRVVEPAVVIDISGISELEGIEDEESLEIGPLTTHTAVATSEVVAGRAPVLSATLEHTADKQIRNQATIGGNLIEAAPGADPPAAAVAANAEFELRDQRGSSTVAAGSFYDRPVPRLAVTELLTGITIPSGAGRIGGYARRTEPASGYAAPGVAVSARLEGGRVESARVVATGIAESPQRLPSVEARLAGFTPDEGRVEDIGVEELAAEDVAERFDPQAARATGENTPVITGEYTRRALIDASDRFGTPPR